MMELRQVFFFFKFLFHFTWSQSKIKGRFVKYFNQINYSLIQRAYYVNCVESSFLLWTNKGNTCFREKINNFLFWILNFNFTKIFEVCLITRSWRRSQFLHCRSFLSHFFRKNFVKAMVLLNIVDLTNFFSVREKFRETNVFTKKSLKNWFDGKILRWK